MGMYNMLVTRMVIIHIKEQIVILCTSIVMWRAYDALCSIKKIILDHRSTLHALPDDFDYVPYLLTIELVIYKLE